MKSLSQPALDKLIDKHIPDTMINKDARLFKIELLKLLIRPADKGIVQETVAYSLKQALHGIYVEISGDITNP